MGGGFIAQVKLATAGKNQNSDCPGCRVGRNWLEKGPEGTSWSEGSGVSQGQGLGYTNVSFVETCLNVYAFYRKNCKQMLNST